MKIIVRQPYRIVIHRVLLLVLLISAVAAVPQQAIAIPPEPYVAIHVSELTQALETIPAIPPTPAGTGTTGYQWWYSTWHYFVAHESLQETLRSDGTPFVIVSDSDIAAGMLLNSDGTPRYPILISLSSEAVDDNEVTPLREYASAGGFLFAGASAFTRNPGGAYRADFALAGEMGLHMAHSTLSEANNWNWYLNTHFTKATDHRLTSHIPGGTLVWRAPMSADEIPWGVSPTRKLHGNYYIWSVVASDAEVIANGDSGPLLAVKKYGQGQIIYHGADQPLIGHGGYDPGMYAYLIYRRAIEWAFESFSLPIVKVSPWPYQYDAAFMVRYDFENYQSAIRSIESSAQYEHSLGAKGDYFFSTGALRDDMGGDPATIASLRSAVSNYGATIGSHNGGLKNPVNYTLLPLDYEYWHWGPDEALDSTPQGYENGKAYASASILASYQDIEGWLAGIDNGRPGCGALGSCPRIWVSPFFNSTREDSVDILEQLGVVTMGEQKISPFPHKTLSYKTRGKFFSPVTLPVSDWYVGGGIVQDNDQHTLDSLKAGIDFYYNLGALINFYGHVPANYGSVQQEYLSYSLSKARLWSTNSVGVNDWWRVRAGVAVTPTFTATGSNRTVSLSVTGATDPATAIEIALPKSQSYTVTNMSIALNGIPAVATDYRSTANGVKILVGSSVSDVQLNYTLQVINHPPVAMNDAFSTAANTPLNQAPPGVLTNDSDPEGDTLTAQLVSGTSHGTVTLNGNGSFVYTPLANYVGSDSFTYMANDETTNSNLAPVIITVTSNSSVFFLDDFTRVPDAPNPLFPWIRVSGTWNVTDGVLQGTSLPLTYASIYTSTMPLPPDYTVEGLIEFQAGAFGGGLGGRVNPANGARYGAWIYPDGSVGGSNLLRLVKFRDWTNWSGAAMKQVSLPGVGTGWHTLKLAFNGSRIQVYYDGTLMIDVVDDNFDSRAAYASGGISGDMWTYTSSRVMGLDNIVVRPLSGNMLPVAVSDTYSTNVNTALNQAVPGVLGNDTDPEGAPLTAHLLSGPSHGSVTVNTDGSFTYTPIANYVGSDSFTYLANDGTSTSNVATVTISVTSTGNVQFSDDFTRVPGAPDTLSPWGGVSGTWTVTDGILHGSGSAYAYSYVSVAPPPLWNDYTLEGRIQFPTGAFGGGFGGRVNPANGAHYGAWIYPDKSLGGSNTLKLIKFRDWTTWNGMPMQVVTLPSVGTGWHALKMVFSGSRIQVYYDGTLMMDVTDNNYDARAAYLTGGISGDMWTYAAPYTMGIDTVVVSTLTGTVLLDAVNDAYSTRANATLNQIAPGVLGNDTVPEGTVLTAQLAGAPSHGTLLLNTDGSFTYTPLANYVGSDSFTYAAKDGTATSNVATVTISVTSTSNVLFSDDFARVPATPSPLSPWNSELGAWTVTDGVLKGAGGASAYSYASVAATSLWNDYALEGRVRLPAGAFGGGLGGRVNPVNGAHYGVWIYPDGSAGGSNKLKLIKFRDWTSWSGTPMQQVNLPSVGTDWHALKIIFSGSRIQVFYDGNLMMDVTDNSYDSRAACLTGGISGDMWTYATPYIMEIDNIVVRTFTSTVPLLAVDDAYSTFINTSLNLAVPGVLANDTAPEGATLVQLVSGPSHGTLALNADGSFRYVPTLDYTGNDSFTYNASDGTTTSNDATVTITLTPADQK